MGAHDLDPRPQDEVDLKAWLISFAPLPRSKTHIDPWPRWRQHDLFPVALADLADPADRAAFN